METNRIYCADTIELLKTFPPESIDYVVFSPPYSVGKEYESESSFQDWVDLTNVVCKELSRVIKSWHFITVNLGELMIYGTKFKKSFVQEKLISPYYERAFEENGTLLYSIRYWDKVGLMWGTCKFVFRSYRSVNQIETIFTYYKPGKLKDRPKYNRDRLTRDEWVDYGYRQIWRIPSVSRFKDHPAEFPIELPRRFIKIYTEPGDIVVDPFLGSGTSAVAAKELGRKYIGIDKEEKYCKIAEKRLNETQERIL